MSGPEERDLTAVRDRIGELAAALSSPELPDEETLLTRIFAPDDPRPETVPAPPSPRRPRMPDLPREELVRRYEAGESVAELARVYAVDRTTLRARLKSWGVRLRDRSEAARLRGACGPQPVIPPRRPRA